MALLSTSLSASVPFLLFLLLPLPSPCALESLRGGGEEGNRSISTMSYPSMSPEFWSNSSTGLGSSSKCSQPVVCKPGTLLPVWKPLGPGLGDQVARAVVYFTCLMYMFLGVSIIADRFMASIEVITSQVCGHGFEAGELGPGTIVGSAAFNMFVIIAICVWVIPEGETRKIKHLRVFFITAFWSIFAYIWLFLILSVISPGVVEVWEALVTLLYFPVCVILAWIADRRLLFYKYMAKRYRADKHGIVVETEGDTTPKGFEMIMDGKFPPRGGAVGMLPNENCQDGANNAAGARVCEYDGPWARVAAAWRSRAPTCQCHGETVGILSWLLGGMGESTFYVDYRTEDGSANAGSDYEYSEGTLVFKPGETRKEIKVGIIDDDIFEEDEHFFVRLLNLRIGDPEGMFESDEPGAGPKGRLVEPLVTMVTILDDDHAGIFTFRDRLVRISESVGTVEFTVVRNSGRPREKGTRPITKEAARERGGVDYEETPGKLGSQRPKTQTLQPFCSTKDPDGQMSAEEEEARRIAEMGKPVLGEHSRLEVVIEESYEFKSTVDKLIKKTNLALVIGTHSWREQFVEAVTVSAERPKCFI
ncbi:unnamed protein product [Coregonus sp. 'balchen']|nr:unnamed protein product [Coregonus sp. 'balchen']